MRSNGSATVELVLVLPLLVAMILYGLYLAQLAQAKLRVQEAARNVAWEMTAHVLTDYGQAQHDAAFSAASAAVSKDAEQRGLGGSWMADYGALKVQLANERPALSASPLPSAWSSGKIGSQAASAARSLPALFDAWSLNPRGQARAEVRMDISSKFLPLGQHLESSHVLLADGWQLPDGADAVMGNGRAGNHPGGTVEAGLHRQVARMTFVGIRSALDRMQGVDAVLSALGKFGLPAFTGTFVVSHNYTSGTTDNGCYARGAESPVNPAPRGLNNVAKTSGLDWPHPRCFDTAPFRDVAQYDKSLYVQMFKARGPNFMGCSNAQADDPTTLHSANGNDASNDHTPCTP